MRNPGRFFFAPLAREEGVCRLSSSPFFPLLLAVSFYGYGKVRTLFELESWRPLRRVLKLTWRVSAGVFGCRGGNPGYFAI